MSKQIYLDNASTTKPFPSVVKTMQKSLEEDYGNPSSLHSKGEEAKELINSAREKLAKEINARSWEIIFTSGATESNNLAIRGLAKANPSKKKIIISSIEHDSVYEPCLSLQKQGYEIVQIPTNSEGIINLELLEKEIDNKTLLVSIIHANNEFGTIQDLEAIGKICLSKKVPFHTDVTQSFTKLPIDIKKSNLSMLSASAHKIHGPKGVGFLYLSEKTKIKPILLGGGQEKSLRSGTENTPNIVGFSEALTEIKKVNGAKIQSLSKKLIKGLESLGGKLNGSRTDRLHNNVNMSFPGQEGDSLVLHLSEKNIFCSIGSACGSNKQSKVQNRILKSLGLSDKEAESSIRFSLSYETTDKEIEETIKQIKSILEI